jgi:hypothetical protein
VKQTRRTPSLPTTTTSIEKEKDIHGYVTFVRRMANVLASHVDLVGTRRKSRKDDREYNKQHVDKQVISYRTTTSLHMNL